MEDAPFDPKWVIAPGATISDWLLEKKIGILSFASNMKMTISEVCNLLIGKTPITKPIAKKLSVVLGSTTRFWLTLEAHYREGLNKGLKDVGTYVRIHMTLKSYEFKIEWPSGCGSVSLIWADIPVAVLARNFSSFSYIEFIYLDDEPPIEQQSGSNFILVGKHSGKVIGLQIPLPLPEAIESAKMDIQVRLDTKLSKSLRADMMNHQLIHEILSKNNKELSGIVKS